MEINVTEILFKPHPMLDDIIPIDIFGEKYAKRVMLPNLYVVKTDTELIDNSERGLQVYPSIIFEKDSIIFELTNVIVKHKEDMCFLECKHWKETYLEVDIL